MEGTDMVRELHAPSFLSALGTITFKPHFDDIILCVCLYLKHRLIETSRADRHRISNITEARVH